MRLQGDLLNLTQFISKFLSISQAEACFFTSTYKKDRSLINYKTHGWSCQPRPQAFFLFLPLRSSTGKALGTRMLCHLFFFASPPVIEMWRIETESSSYHPTPVFSYDPFTLSSERANQTKYGFGVYLKHVPTLFVQYFPY